jgi:hypothetical protein
MEPQRPGSDGGTRTNLLFTMSYRTGTGHEVRRKLVFSANDAPHLLNTLWWSRTGSNRRHPACKAGALPAELRPLKGMKVVGLGGLEPPTSRLSSARSNQLSYKPSTEPHWRQSAPARHACWQSQEGRLVHHSRRKRNEGGRSR